MNQIIPRLNMILMSRARAQPAEALYLLFISTFYSAKENFCITCISNL